MVIIFLIASLLGGISLNAVINMGDTDPLNKKTDIITLVVAILISILFISLVSINWGIWFTEIVKRLSNRFLSYLLLLLL